MKQLACLIALGLGACGGPAGSPVGIYKVDAMSVDAQGCGPGAPAAAPPLYLQLKQDSLLGSPYFDFLTCQSAEPTSCGGSFGLPIYVPTDSGGAGYIAAASPTSSACTLQDAEASFSVTGSALRHEQHIYRLSNATDVPCTQDEAKQRGTSLPCIGYQLTLATRVSP